MIKTVVTAAAAAVAVLTCSGVASANPATPMPVIESSSAQLCQAVNDRPTQGGVIDGLNSLEGNQLDEMDVSLVIITAMHHVCPQHEELLFGLATSAASDELCGRPA